jgi:FkbM family methyltransferase
MSLLARLNRPEYLYRPRAVLRRLLTGRRAPSGGKATTARLPWGKEICVFPDALGRSLIASGVFDPCGTETIHRLVEPGGVAVDVGANVGYVTSLLTVRAGPGGRVVSFEPEPAVFEILERNVRRWNTDPAIAAATAQPLAISNTSGTGQLRSEGTPDSHMGLSSLRRTGNIGDAHTLEVEVAKLDDLFAGDELQLLKIDVEGHERDVLEGAARLIEQGRIRDIVFEEHAIYPAPSMTFLEERGMTLFTLKHSPLGLRIQPIQDGPAPPGWPGPNYLATIEPARALRLLRPRGWRFLGGVARLGRATT